MTNNFLYFDNAATTRPNKDALEYFASIESEYFANPNSIHHLGIKTNSLLNKARESILNSFKCKNHRVIFTSSASEANNLAIKGYCLSHKNRGNHIITTAIEHPSVLECFKQLEQFGFELTILQVNDNGIISVDDLAKAIKNNTIFVSIMAVNNEIGSINPIKDIINIVSKYPKIALHVDTTQAIGKINLPYNDIDSFVVSSHKIHGLKNSGALIVKKSIDLLPIISGGGQEDGFRSGTQSVALALTLAKLIKEEVNCLDNNYRYVRELYTFAKSELEKIDNIVINSSENCSCYILNFSLKKKKASVVVEALSNKGIYVSTVSACHSKKETMSYVLKAMGKNDIVSSNSIRLSFDRSNTKEEISLFIDTLKNILESIK